MYSNLTYFRRDDKNGSDNHVQLLQVAQLIVPFKSKNSSKSGSYRWNDLATFTCSKLRRFRKIDSRNASSLVPSSGDITTFLILEQDRFGFHSKQASSVTQLHASPVTQLQPRTNRSFCACAGL